MISGPELWLVRHGETEWSLSGRHTGRTDLPLTELGRSKATAIRDFLERRQFAMVLTSPLQRAVETCRIAGYGHSALCEPDLQEWDYGSYEGRTTAEIRESEPGWSIWTASAGSGEGLEGVGRRADRVIGRAAGAGGDVLLFAHGHLLRVLAARWLGWPPDGGQYFALQTASLSILGHEREARVIRLWNRLPDQ